MNTGSLSALDVVSVLESCWRLVAVFSSLESLLLEHHKERPHPTWGLSTSNLGIEYVSSHGIESGPT